MQPLLDRRLDDWHLRLSGDQPGTDYQPLLSLITSLDAASLRRLLARVLPLSLRLLDHHHAANKLLGIQAISHVISLLPHHELSRMGTDQLLMHSLKNCLAFEELVLSVMPPLMAAMKKFQVDPTSATADDVLLTIMRGLEMSSSLASKLIYWKSLHQTIDFVGVSVIRLSKRIMIRMTDHLSYPLTAESEEMFSELLTCVDSFVQVTRERSHRFSAEVLFAVCSFLYSNYKGIRDCNQVQDASLALLRSLADVDAIAVRRAIDVLRKNDPQDRMSFMLHRLESLEQISCLEAVVTDH